MNSSTEHALSIFCQEHCLSVDCFEKLKQVIMKDKIIIDKKYATAWYMKFFSMSLLQVIDFIKENYPKLYKLIRHGDVIVNTNTPFIGQFDIYFVVKKDNKIKLISCENDVLIPKQFKVIDCYRGIDYWYETNDIVINGESFEFSEVNWDHEFDNVPISDKLKKRIQPVTDALFNSIPERARQFMDDNFCRDEILYLRYNNKVYIFIKNEYENYINREDTVILDVTSRWKLIKCCIKFLSLHKRAVERVNHPERLLEQGVFDEV